MPGRGRAISLQRGPAPKPQLVFENRHAIDDIRCRFDNPEQNFILCYCGWRDVPHLFPVHRSEALKALRAAAGPS